MLSYYERSLRWLDISYGKPDKMDDVTGQAVPGCEYEHKRARSLMKVNGAFIHLDELED